MDKVEVCVYNFENNILHTKPTEQDFERDLGGAL